jgi:hypothetical protein
MFTCVICHFDVELDDAIAPVRGGRCICLACCTREADAALNMSKHLRQELGATLEGLSASPLT